jgi:putative endonuclease
LVQALSPARPVGDGGCVTTRTELGARGERIAAAFLTDAGLRLLDRNWRCRDGELDIVARDGDALVFCEVKTREEHARDLRFDVVGVLVRPAGPAVVTHLRGAFS